MLGVSEDADPDEIARAYRELTHRRATGRLGAADGRPLEHLRQAFETLSDEGRRRDYDAQLASRRRPDRLGERAGCFADEVAVDFPSPSRVVGRMLESFFADRDSALRTSAEISVTPQEAFHGARIPVDLPVRGSCPECGGRGEFWTERCEACDGTGSGASRHRVQLSVPARLRDGAQLRFVIKVPDGPTIPVDVRFVIR